MKKFFVFLLTAMSFLSFPVHKSEAACKFYSWMEEIPASLVSVRVTQVQALTIREYSSNGYIAFKYLVEYPTSAKEALVLQVPVRSSSEYGYGDGVTTHYAVRTIRPAPTLDSTCWIEVKNFTISLTGSTSSENSFIFLITAEE